MSEIIDNGGPAFPQTFESWRGTDAVPDGMSLRDWFAGEYKVERNSDGSLLGYGCETLSRLCKIPEPTQGDYLDRLKWEIRVEATLKFLHADAMLEERKKVKL